LRNIVVVTVKFNEYAYLIHAFFNISVIGISGPIDASITIKTQSNKREENMVSFTEHALSLFLKVLMDNPNVPS